MSDIESVLRDAIGTGEIIEVVYLGGSQPGTRRDLSPKSIDPPHLRAWCHETEAEKTFRIDRMVLAEGAYRAAPKYGADGRGSAPLTWQEFLQRFRELAFPVGIHVDVREDGVRLYGLKPNGQPSDVPSASLTRHGQSRFAVTTPDWERSTTGKLPKAIEKFAEGLQLNAEIVAHLVVPSMAPQVPPALPQRQPVSAAAAKSGRTWWWWLMAGMAVIGLVSQANKFGYLPALLAICFLICLAGVIYPFRPFRNRWWAIAAGAAMFGAMAAALPPETADQRPQREADRVVTVAQPSPQPRASGAAQADPPTIRDRDHRSAQTKRIPAPGEPRVAYTALEVSLSPIGRVILSQRDGPSGRSFTRRECTCPVGRYRTLGTGETMWAAMKDRAPERLVELVFDRDTGLGSSAYYACAFACEAIL